MSHGCNQCTRIEEQIIYDLTTVASKTSGYFIYILHYHYNVMHIKHCAGTVMKY